MARFRALDIEWVKVFRRTDIGADATRGTRLRLVRPERPT